MLAAWPKDVSAAARRADAASVPAMVQRSTSPGAGSSSSPSNTFGSAVAAGVDDDQIVDDFPVEADREQEAALAARIAELSQDFLADSGVGLAPEIFDRMCEGFVTLQDLTCLSEQQLTEEVSCVMQPAEHRRLHRTLQTDAGECGLSQFARDIGCLGRVEWLAKGVNE